MAMALALIGTIYQSPKYVIRRLIRSYDGRLLFPADKDQSITPWCIDRFIHFCIYLYIFLIYISPLENQIKPNQKILAGCWQRRTQCRNPGPGCLVICCCCCCCCCCWLALSRGWAGFTRAICWRESGKWVLKPRPPGATRTPAANQS